MSTKPKRPIENTADREIVISRIFDAPRELVWEAMTDPRHVVHWWGPRGFTSSIETMDVRPGGVWQFVMHGPDGVNYPNRHVFTEVTKPGRIVMTHGGHRENGPSVNALATWTFETVEPSRTRVTIHMIFPTAEDRAFVVKEFKAIDGGNQTLTRLGEFLARKPLVIERELEAPIEQVWQAITDVTHMRQWYFPQLENFEARVGFETHFNVHHNGKDYLHQWKVTEVVPREKLGYLWSFRGFPGESLLTFELAKVGRKTRLRLTHSGLETFEPENHPELAIGNFRAGWTAITAQLDQFLAQKEIFTPA